MIVLMKDPFTEENSGDACIRDDDERIFSPHIDALDMAMPLVDLTYKTRATHSVHDFTKAAIGDGVPLDAPLASEAGVNHLQEIHVFSSTPIKNGDVVITNTGVRMAFDVEASARTKNFYTMHAVARIPSFHIGHAVSAP